MLRSLLIVLFLSVTACAETQVITVLHTNDMHGALLPQADFESSGVRKPDRGGAARIATILAAERASAEKEGRAVLVVDAGDIFHGTPEGNETRGAAVIAWMNLVHYDALALGNHDWAYGDANLRSLRTQAKFEFLTCNVTKVDPTAATAPIIDYAKPYIVLSEKGVRVALVGFTTPGTPAMNLPEHVAGLDFLPYVRQGAYYLKQARGESDVVIALSHLGSSSDEALARKVPGWDLIVGGHDHRTFHKGLEKSGTLIVQTGCDGAFVGRVDITWDRDTHRVVSRTARLIPVTSEVASDAASEELIQKSVKGDLDKPFGTTACFLGRGGPDSPLGCVLADAIRTGADADAALLNSGGVRNDLPAGPVTKRDLYMAAPFEDTLVTYRMTGADLVRLLDGAYRDGSLEYPVSGLQFSYDGRKPAGERVVGLRVGGQEVDLAHAYVLATTRFAAARLENDTVTRRVIAPEGVPLGRTDLAKTVQESLQKIFQGGIVVGPPDGKRVTFLGNRK